MPFRVARALEAFWRTLTRPVTEIVHPQRVTPIGVALGGGFARGLAHIGVLKVLEAERIPIRYLAGTSVGALLAAIYASGVPLPEMEAMAHSVRWKDFARWTISRHGLASNDRMVPFLKKILRVETFEELEMPLAVVATDFLSGQPVVFRSGPLIPAIRASCAYPGVFVPVEVNGRLMVDGLLAYSVPTVPLRQMGAERVLASHLRASWVSKDGPQHVLEIIAQCFSIAQNKMCGEWKAAADLILEPDVAGFAHDAFERASELIRRGEEATRPVLPEIRGWLAAPATTTATAKPAEAPASAK
ncbi:MAG TPA: patatin-like phospholipase family protein [Terriglobales bacterium]|nr:patatin-like phospholipase family protein [Terriglobales bacterium]